MIKVFKMNVLYLMAVLWTNIIPGIIVSHSVNEYFANFSIDSFITTTIVGVIVIVYRLRYHPLIFSSLNPFIFFQF